MYIHVHFTLANPTLRGSAYGAEKSKENSSSNLQIYRHSVESRTPVLLWLLMLWVPILFAEQPVL